jgi:hypothetical protein
MCSYGRAPDLKQRLVLELAGRCQSDSIGLHSAAAAAVTAAMSAMQKQLQPQLESVRSGVAVTASTALRLLGGDTDEFDEAIAEMSIALDEAEATVSGLAQEPDEVGKCAVISRRRLEQSLTAADFQQVGVSKSERARLTDAYFELRESEREKMTGAYFDKYNLMVSVVRQLQAQVCDLSQQVGTAKGRRCKDVILEKRLKKMLVKELQSECLARGFSDSGTAPELRLRIGLELAGMSCKCRNAVASGVVAAVTAEANVVTTDADEVQTAIEAELRAEHAEYLAAVEAEAAEEAAPAEGDSAEDEKAAPAEGESVETEDAALVGDLVGEEAAEEAAENESAENEEQEAARITSLYWAIEHPMQMTDAEAAKETAITATIIRDQRAALAEMRRGGCYSLITDEKDVENG